MPRGSRRFRRVCVLLVVVGVAAACGGGGRDATTRMAAESVSQPRAEAGDGSGGASRGRERRGVVTVTDLAGRDVEVDVPVGRMLLGQARLFYMTAILDRDDPLARVAGWPDDLKSADPDAFDVYAEEFPDVADVPEIGSVGKGSFSTEAAIALEPDVLVLTLSDYEPAVELGAVEVLASAGIPTVVVDFHDHPLENTVPSARLLGEIMDREAEADAFAGFYEDQVELVSGRLASPALTAGDRPSTFLYRAAGLLECCATFGRSNLGDLVEAAGGDNIGTGMLPGAQGVLNPEAVLDADPDVIIATGANWKNQETKLPGVGFVSLGYRADPAVAAAQLAGLTDQPGWDTLAAVRDGRFYGVWHQFYTSPYNFVALLRFAKWLHPDRFDDVDPEAVFDEFHDRFLPVGYRGAFWTALP